MNKRLLNISEACEYISMKPGKTRTFLREIGAEKRIGRAVRYDSRVIDSYFDGKGDKDERDGKAS